MSTTFDEPQKSPVPPTTTPSDITDGMAELETPKTTQEETDIWAEAMAEQGGAFEETLNRESTDQNQKESDPWAAAMAEQEGAVDAESAPKTPKSVQSFEVFKSLDGSTTTSSPRDLSLIMNIPVKLHVELGRTKISIKQLLELNQGSVLELDGLAGDPMDILINGYLIAQGEVVVVEDKYGIRITDVITQSERIEKLNR